VGDVRIDLVEISFWEGLYIDGELRHQDHRIDARTVLDILTDSSGLLDGIRVTNSFHVGEAADKLDDGSGLPDPMPQWLRKAIDDG
jgi:hypothetical protein